MTTGRGYELARELYPLTDCVRCGKPGVERHHHDGNEFNNVPTNVSVLCRRCHMAVDGRLEKTAQRAREMNAKRRAKAPRQCRICNRPAKVGTVKGGRCKGCYSYWWRFGVERPTDKPFADKKQKLDARMVKIIRESKTPNQLLAHLFGVSYQTIVDVKARRSWRQI